MRYGGISMLVIFSSEAIWDQKIVEIQLLKTLIYQTIKLKKQNHDTNRLAL